MLEHGIKPVYVFDGKPPQLKSGEVCVLPRCRLLLLFKTFFLCVFMGESSLPMSSHKQKQIRHWHEFTLGTF